ncbi:MAG: hypothetical protein N2049_04840 [Anaerolineales bacterium]|nr:hypothetical protein [Anaerolineales bacterium]
MRPVFVLLLLSLLLLPACQARPLPPGWRPETLRLLDPLDAPSPSTELLALYLRQRGADLEIRLDFLDIPLHPDYDLLLILSTPLETLHLTFPANDLPTVSPPSRLRPRIVRDPWLDIVIIRLNRHLIFSPFTIQAFVSPVNQPSVADRTDPIRSDALPPTRRAPVLLVFSDVFHAYTPAQALRRWDGAHTGPRGGRHGLRHLLEASQFHQLPVVLLDVKNPASLAALEYVGGLGKIRNLAERGLLILPEVAYSQPAEQALALSRQAARGFRLPGSSFVYAAAGEVQSSYRLQFLPLDDPTHLARAATLRLAPLVTEETAQVDENGLTLAIRRSLAQALFADAPPPLTVLGGRLPLSLFGDAELGPMAFAWLAARPWIWVLDGYDLLTFPVSGDFAPKPTSFSSSWITALEQAPENSLSKSAWLTFLELNRPVSNPKLAALQEIYLGQVGILLEAARWAEQPVPRAECTTDLDADGAPDCLLAGPSVLAVIDPLGARLTHLFILDESGPHQLVAPTAQFVVGLSDPSQWRLEAGEAADPGALMGAFSDSGKEFAPYTVETLTDYQLTFRRADDLRKTFRLTERGVQVSYENASFVTTRIPLVADPWLFYAAPQEFRARLTPGLSWSWEAENGLQVEVRTDAHLSAAGFNVSRQFMNTPENPNFDFPAEHFLPFPFSLVKIYGQGEFTIWLEGN